MDSLAETEPARTNPKIINTTLCISFFKLLFMMFLFFHSGRGAVQARNSAGLHKILFLTLADIFPDQVRDDKSNTLSANLIYFVKGLPKKTAESPQQTLLQFPF